MFSKLATKDPANNGRERYRRIERDRACCAAETAEQKEHRLSKPRTKDRARHAACAAACAAAKLVSRDYCSLVPRPRPAFRRLQYRKTTESWAGPGNKAKTTAEYPCPLFRSENEANC